MCGDRTSTRSILVFPLVALFHAPKILEGDESGERSQKKRGKISNNYFASFRSSHESRTHAALGMVHILIFQPGILTWLRGESRGTAGLCFVLLVPLFSSLAFLRPRRTCLSVCTFYVLRASSVSANFLIKRPKLETFFFRPQREMGKK